MITSGRTWSRPAGSVQGQRLGRLVAARLAAARAHAHDRLLPRLWWPLEAGSDLTALWAHDANRPLPEYIPDRNGADLVVILQQVRRRIAIQRFLILSLRTLWLALLVALVLMLARYVTVVPWSAVAVAVGLVVLLALLYHRAHPLTVWTAARLLDRHWRLHEQVATAVELAVTPTRLRLASFQILSALQQVRAARNHHRLLPRLPATELHVALALGLLVVGLSLATGPAERLAPPSNPLSQEMSTQVNIGELGATDPAQLAPFGEDPATAIDPEMGAGVVSPEYELGTIDPEALREAAALSSRSQQELEQIAEALKDASITSQAAQEIQAGNYEQAAQQIADLARSIDQLSPEARRDLSERLQQASQNVDPIDPELARRLEQAAKAMASRSDRAAAQGLEDVSQAISDAGKNIIPQSTLGDAIDEAGMSGEAYEDGPGRAQQGEQGGQDGQAGQSALGEGEAGEHGFAQSESALTIGASAGGQSSEEATTGAGAGQGTSPDNERYEASTNPNAVRVEVKPEQAEGPNAPKQGQSRPGAPDVITTGPGSTGPGSVTPSNQPISTGLDPNRVPRSLQKVIEGYFRGSSGGQSGGQPTGGQR